MQREGIEYGGEQFPPVAEGFGWVMELGPLIFMVIMPVWQVYKLSKENIPLSEMWKKLTQPSKSWYEVERDEGKPNEIGMTNIGQENPGYTADTPTNPPPYSEVI